MKHKSERLVVRGALAGVVAVSAMVAVWAIACLDTTPELVIQKSITFDAYVPPPMLPPDVFIPDGADAAAYLPEVDPRGPCQKCLETPDMPGPGCGTEIATCKADPQCSQMYECALQNGCLYAPMPQQAITCVLPCTIEAGVTMTSSGPGADLLAVAECGLRSCTVCWPDREAGLPFDY